MVAELTLPLINLGYHALQTICIHEIDASKNSAPLEYPNFLKSYESTLNKIANCSKKIGNLTCKTINVLMLIAEVAAYVFANIYLGVLVQNYFNLSNFSGFLVFIGSALIIGYVLYELMAYINDLLGNQKTISENDVQHLEENKNEILNNRLVSLKHGPDTSHFDGFIKIVREALLFLKLILQIAAIVCMPEFWPFWLPTLILQSYSLVRLFSQKWVHANFQSGPQTLLFNNFSLKTIDIETSFSSLLVKDTNLDPNNICPICLNPNTTQDPLYYFCQNHSYHMDCMIVQPLQKISRLFQNRGIKYKRIEEIVQKYDQYGHYMGTETTVKYDITIPKEAFATCAMCKNPSEYSEIDLYVKEEGNSSIYTANLILE